MIKLGDYISRINNDNKNHIRSYRVIRLNPKIKLHEVLLVNGEQELGEIIELTNNDIKKLKRSHNQSCYWVGNF